MQTADLALQRNKYKHLSDEEWRWYLQQEEGRARTADKLPTFAAIKDWWYPVRLSCEQCSSEATARYKVSIVESRKSKVESKEVESQKSKVESQKSKVESRSSRFADLTGGYGVDTCFLSECFAHTDYVEQDAELCRIAEHNFEVRRSDVRCTKGRSVAIHNCTAEEFLSALPSGESPEACFSLIYMDPARRDSHGGKVFRLADCTPNVVELLPELVVHLKDGGMLMLKLSPMLDITQALKELSETSSQLSEWEVHVVAVKNEVKEVLLISRKSKVESRKQEGVYSRKSKVESRKVKVESRKSKVESRKQEGDTGRKVSITAIDLAEPEKAFVFTREEEQGTNVPLVQGSLPPCCYLYEPNAAILKAGAYKLAGARSGLQKPDKNTHLYCSETLVENFPGRIWKAVPLPSPKERAVSQANVLVRNYPLTAEQLKKKLRLRDGGTAYIIGCRVAGKPTLFLAERLF